MQISIVVIADSYRSVFHRPHRIENGEKKKKEKRYSNTASGNGKENENTSPNNSYTIVLNIDDKRQNRIHFLISPHLSIIMAKEQKKGNVLLLS